MLFLVIVFKYSLADISSMETTGIYAHIAEDGFVHASYDAPFTVVQNLEPPEDTIMSTLEYVEKEFFHADGSDDLIDELMPESDRVDEPPQVGELHYEDGQIYEVNINVEEYAGQWM